MSTRSIIALDTEFFAPYRAIYCHYDGYPTGVGRTLFSNYGSDNIEELINLGSLSSLQRKLEPYEGEAHSFDNPAPNTTVAYHRDRGEEWELVKPRECRGLPELITFALQSGAEWLYLFDMESKLWRVMETRPQLKALDRTIKEEEQRIAALEAKRAAS